MKNYILLSAFAVLGGLSLTNAQDNGNKVLMTVGGDKVTLNEFENVYYKNNTNKTNDPKSLQEYLDLYTNFRLKVKEAKDIGLDTSAAFRNELMGYRKQLSQPYLTDTVINDKLLMESYDRMKWDVRAYHILVKCDADALPKDTLIAYNKALKIRDRILKGEDFGKVANVTTDDTYGRTNGGDLGYFTALIGFVYPFESAAYNLKIGDLSMPVRTQFGYHIIKVTEKVEHVDLLTAHIMIKFNKGMSAADSTAAVKKMEDIYNQLKKGVPFDTLCAKFSEDPGSSKKGGVLQLMGRSSNFPPEFKDAAFALKKDGDFSAPIKTRFGWHIVKRVSSKSLAPYNDMKGELKNKIAKDMRSNMSRTSLIAKIKKEYNFKENTKMRDELKGALDTAIFMGKWQAIKASKFTKEIFSLGDKKYTQTDFAKYIESHQAPRAKVDFAVLLNSMYKVWVEETVVAYEESRLDVKYPKFKALMDEYRDGILLFELTDKKVWSKAVKDTTGLKEYYEKNKTKWLWDERADVKIYTCADVKTAEKVRKMIAKNKTDKEILDALNVKGQISVTVENKLYNKGDNAMVDASWTPGLSPNKTENGKVVFAHVLKITPQTPKTLNEAKGLVTADYQQYLDKMWIEDLKKKYAVKIDQDVLKLVK
jgi:peptidyl-prolyl cis-trans isomerase SurA